MAIPTGALPAEAVIGVAGAGTMGAGIAQVAAAAGHPVRLFDAREGAAEEGIGRLRQGLDRQVARGRMTADDRDALLGRITAVGRLELLAPCALVVEAIVEDLEVKRGLLRELEGLCAAETILASNTSSLSITALAAGLDHPERVVGMHFFNPVPVMRLVEVVRGLATDPAAAGCVRATAAGWGKDAVAVKSTPGFIVNRVARPFYAEALRVLEEGGGAPETLDALLREAGGFRMGPFELMDLIGHDVNFAVTGSVYAAYYQDPRFLPSLIQQELVAGGFLGRKSGRGFYDYAEGAVRPEPATLAPGPRPESVTVHGAPGPAAGLVQRLESAGLRLRRTESAGAGWLEVDGVAVALTDGRMATQRAVAERRAALVLFDLALDYGQATRIGIATADQAGPAAQARAAGLFQAAGLAVSGLDDVPGLIVARTVAMLANEAADTVNQGVADAAGVDAAMRGGVNYPRGPLAWCDALGADWVVRVLEHLGATYGLDRYRVSPLLRRKFWSRGSFHGKQ